MYRNVILTDLQFSSELSSDLKLGLRLELRLGSEAGEVEDDEDSRCSWRVRFRYTCMCFQLT